MAKEACMEDQGESTEQSKTHIVSVGNSLVRYARAQAQETVKENHSKQTKSTQSKEK